VNPLRRALLAAAATGALCGPLAPAVKAQRLRRIGYFGVTPSDADTTRRTLELFRTGLREQGLVESLARPGGNVTGVTNVLPALSGKLLELAREIGPGTSRVAVMWNPDNPAKTLELHELQAAAQRSRIALSLRPARTAAEIDAALADLGSLGVQFLVTLSETLTHQYRMRIAELALAARMPSVSNHAPQVEAGGLVAYAPDYALLNRRLGDLAGRILGGEQPATLPVEQPTNFELVVNLRTARSLGLKIPQSVLLRANRVIE